MSFQGPDPFGTPGGQEDLDKPTSPPDVRVAMTQAAIVYLRVNGPITIRNRNAVEQIVTIEQPPMPIASEEFAEAADPSPLITQLAIGVVVGPVVTASITLPIAGVTYTSVIIGSFEFAGAGTTVDIGTKLSSESTISWGGGQAGTINYVSRVYQRAGPNITASSTGMVVSAGLYYRVNSGSSFGIQNRYISLRLTPL